MTADQRAEMPLPRDGFRVLADALVWLEAAWERVRAANPPTWRQDSPAATETAAGSRTWGAATVRNAHVDALLPLASAGDHLRTLADVLAGPRGIFASYTVARGALEAAAKTWYLLEPDIGAEERARRRINDRLYSLHSTVLLFDGLDERADQQQTAIETLLATAARHGIYARPGKGGREFPFVLERQPREMALLRDMLVDSEQGLDVGGTSYRMLSSVAHATAYGLVGLVEASGPSSEPGVSNGRIRQNSATTAAHFLMVPLAYVQAAERVIRDYGWDSTGWREPVLEALRVWREHSLQAGVTKG